MFHIGRGTRVVPFPARIWGGLLLAALIGAAGTAPLYASELPEGDKEGAAAAQAVAYVNGEAILAAEVERTLAARVPKVTGHGVLSDERIRFHRDQIVREMVVRKLMLQAATKAGVAVSDAEIEAEEAKLRQRFPSDEDYRRAVSAQGLDVTAIRAGLREHLMGEKLAEQVAARVPAPTEGDLMAYYDGHREQFVIPTQAAISYLMLRVDPSAPKDVWDAARDRLKAVGDRITAGESFDAVAAEVAAGGELSLVTLGLVHQGQTGVEEIDRMAFDMASGAVSEPVWTLYGYALVRVGERKPGRQLAFDELNRALFKTEWLEARRKEARNEWLAGLVREAELKFVE